MMTEMHVGDLVKLNTGRGKAGQPYEIVQIYGDNLSLKRDHMIIHNVHKEDVEPARARREPAYA